MFIQETRYSIQEVLRWIFWTHTSSFNELHHCAYILELCLGNDCVQRLLSRGLLFRGVSAVGHKCLDQHNTELAYMARTPNIKTKNMKINRQSIHSYIQDEWPIHFSEHQKISKHIINHYSLESTWMEHSWGIIKTNDARTWQCERSGLDRQNGLHGIVNLTEQSVGDQRRSD